MPPDPHVHEEALGVETEVGATSGDTHHDILMRTLGRERGLNVAIRRGPPAVRK